MKKLADNHPELADKITNDRVKIVRIENNTERFGIFFASVVAIVLFIAAAFTLVELGWWQSFMFVAILLGVSHVLRTILKGEFSDTSWFGRMLGGKPGKDGNTDK